jgi:predicted DNA-binding WGR domain protein
MIKLYKAGDELRYWEAWSTDIVVTIHWGVVGNNGETREIQFKQGENPNAIIEREAKQPKKAGYRKIPASKLQRLVIQYPVGEMGEVEDLDKREELMNECLGWKGLGHCDGGDVGGGTMNVFCFVVDAEKAVPHVVEELKANGLIDGATVVMGQKAKVVWPKNSKGKLSI